MISFFYQENLSLTPGIKNFVLFEDSALRLCLKIIVDEQVLLFYLLLFLR